ncbi:UMP kinase [Prosthecomicrobium pneumaticum]|uniref:Uridylate kinase n=1 Tax=Prosthecomicrobium pneumaticum TaxID=81895 RepID=A0A7W9CSX1_9HYPH|nr:UMP kinase [Prosthecomicrobium pneumaticum]MBB5751320.1 uridylate kinase [Prosthecomicrobium pneumaticum]
MAGVSRFRRVLLKVSGEALLGDQAFGIDDKVVDRIAGEIGAAVAMGVEVGLVVGGGNIFRGMTIAKAGGNRVAGDHMGMLATVMNAVALHEGLERRSVACRIFSAVPMPTICETFSQQRAEKAMTLGKVAIFAGGTGNPFFTTDSGAALRAAEMGCDALFKGTQVDGVYSADPKKDPNATRFERISHAEVLARGLQVMDAAAVALARDNRIPVIVFSIQTPNAFVDILTGGGRATIVADD